MTLKNARAVYQWNAAATNLTSSRFKVVFLTFPRRPWRSMVIFTLSMAAGDCHHVKNFPSTKSEALCELLASKALQVDSLRSLGFSFLCEMLKYCSDGEPQVAVALTGFKKATFEGSVNKTRWATVNKRQIKTVTHVAILQFGVWSL